MSDCPSNGVQFESCSAPHKGRTWALGGEGVDGAKANVYGEWRPQPASCRANRGWGVRLTLLFGPFRDDGGHASDPERECC